MGFKGHSDSVDRNPPGCIPTLGFVLAGLGVFGVPGLAELWRTIALVSAVLSLLLLFRHPWIILGVLIDVGIIFSLLWADWPSQALIGY